MPILWTNQVDVIYPLRKWGKSVRLALRDLNWPAIAVYGSIVGFWVITVYEICRLAGVK